MPSRVLLVIAVPLALLVVSLSVAATWSSSAGAESNVRPGAEVIAAQATPQGCPPGRFSAPSFPG